LHRQPICAPEQCGAERVWNVRVNTEVEPDL
jgi:hypothetical protein